MRFFWQKKKKEPRVYEGRFITEDEIKEMTKSHNETYIFKDDIDELFELFDKLKEEYGRR